MTPRCPKRVISEGNANSAKQAKANNNNPRPINAPVKISGRLFVPAATGSAGLASATGGGVATAAGIGGSDCPPSFSATRWGIVLRGGVERFASKLGPDRGTVDRTEEETAEIPL